LSYDGRPGKNIRALNEYMVPFLWDLGYDNSFAVRSVDQAVELSKRDVKVFTSYLHSRLLAGSGDPYGRLRLRIEGFRPGARPSEFQKFEMWERSDSLPEQHHALYELEPNVKEGAGGLRDYHAGLWLSTVHFGAPTLDGVAGRGLISEEERLELAQALDLMWRIRNELHFSAGKAEDRLTYRNEEDLAIAFGYTDAAERDTSRFMRDYYRAARTLRDFLRKISRKCRNAESAEPVNASRQESSAFSVVNGELNAGMHDIHWFEESPSRLMSVIWESARREVPLSPETQERITSNLHLAGETFCANDLVRRFFLAICNRPHTAGIALRQAAHTGLLDRYLPEFAAIRDIIRYEDFHSYPVDEHTLRAIEALANIPHMTGPVGEFLKVTLEHLSDPYILVLALLFHDLGKVEGEKHSAGGTRIAREICTRIGLPEEDTERIAFLVRHHLLMTHNALYRDTDDVDIIQDFAKTMKSEHRMRALLLLSYADLSAVGPKVWTEWKGTLLMELYLRTEKVLAGRSETVDEAFWEHPKSDLVRGRLPDRLRGLVESHVRDLGNRYFAGFSAEAIAGHIECLEAAGENGFAVSIVTNDETNMSEVVICTPDHRGLFQELAGCFASQLIEVEKAALYTRSDGMALDCFTVMSASRLKALTQRQANAFKKVLTDVLSGVKSLEDYLEESQRRIFRLLHPPVPIRTNIQFDNTASRRYTVIDIMTGDRTGLLYDIAHALTEHGLDIASARIVTDARRVRDSFYIALNHEKVTDTELQAEIEESLRAAIHARPLAETKGGSI
ncbi:MAG: [protein-PII] uridylyltransferase, partial [Candidatus Hydrogenedentes bacterium]|nr:[protein-PII] uridylyltransferase [Candidatus Hydrogenedentota bacterium]